MASLLLDQPRITVEELQVYLLNLRDLTGDFDEGLLEKMQTVRQVLMKMQLMYADSLKQASALAIAISSLEVFLQHFEGQPLREVDFKKALVYDGQLDLIPLAFKVNVLLTGSTDVYETIAIVERVMDVVEVLLKPQERIGAGFSGAYCVLSDTWSQLVMLKSCDQNR